LQNPSQTNGYNLNNVRRETVTTFWNKKEEHLKGKLMSSKQTVRTQISQTSIKTFSIDGIITFLSYEMYVKITMLDRNAYS